jgi:hypothetical protein
MTQTPPNLLELAKQGNANAIAALMNRQLQPKGMTAKAALKDGCLQIMLESAQVPNQQALVAFIRKGITSLEVASIQRMKVYGRHIGEEFPAWSQEFELGRQSNLQKKAPLFKGGWGDRLLLVIRRLNIPQTCRIANPIFRTSKTV